MGYYTQYDVSTEGADKRKALAALASTVEYVGQFTGDNSWSTGNPVKWYSWKRDLVSVSTEYSNTLFIVEGAGEDSGDIWKAWGYKGDIEIVTAVIEFPEPVWVSGAVRASIERAEEENARRIEMEERAQLEILKAKYENT